MSQYIIYISLVLHLVYSTAVRLLSYIALSLELGWPTSAKSLLLDCRKPENKFENAPCSSWYLEQCIFRCILPSHGVQNDQISPYLNWKHWSSCITKHLLDKVEHSRASTHLYSPGVGALFEPENICWMAATMWDCCLTGVFKEQDHPSLKMLDTFVLSYRSVWVQSSIYLFISKEHLHHHSYL